MLNQRPGLILGFLVVFLLACVAGILSVTLFFQNVSGPTVTVQEYFNALKNKDYNRAYTYFDPKGTINDGKKDQPVSSKLLNSLDEKKGALKSYSIVNTLVSPGNTVIIVVDVRRSNQNQPYKLHLSLREEAGGWKIIREDGI
jgi:hypothetical protein